ncbi:hypothetical protein CY0110_19752 [Crocosphaera chwakensis CCY0110]|uniref:Uncharacterized protein n=1 Tax=Crocosphaera chwakensis CCY0110 TaxID=391612 RepID=A3IJT2_9CHRO|nr:hypothetical protein CY0110_19752 [Crocosphaera chwakensis CCY0110]
MSSLNFKAKFIIFFCFFSKNLRLT